MTELRREISRLACMQQGEPKVSDASGVRNCDLHKLCECLSRDRQKVAVPVFAFR